MDFDIYAWRARRVPLLLAVAPALPLIGGLVPTSTLGRGGALALTVMLVLGAQIARDVGRSLEQDLWACWGGAPTQRALRFAGAESPERVQRLHDRIAEATGDSLPTAGEEASDPAACEERYAEAVATLRELTRNRDEFPLVFEENTNYGLRRNLLGLKPWGIGICLTTAMVAGGFLALGGSTLDQGRAGWVLALGLCALMLFVWIVVVNERWVRNAADLYATRLFEAVDRLRRRAA